MTDATQRNHRAGLTAAAAALLLTAAGTATAEPIATEQLFSPMHPAIVYDDTVDGSDPDAPKLFEEGSQIRFAFDGTSLVLQFEEEATGADQSVVRVSIDGVESLLNLKTGDHTYVAGRNLVDGHHQAVLTKLTGGSSPLVFRGLELAPGATLLFDSDEVLELQLEPGETYRAETASGPVCFHNASATIADMKLCKWGRCSMWAGTKLAGQKHRFSDHAGDMQEAKISVVNLVGEWKERHIIRMPDHLRGGQTLKLKGTVFKTSWETVNDCS